MADLGLGARVRARLLIVVLTTLVVIGSAVVAAPAAGAADLSCPADLANARPVPPKDATHPVVLVHGLNSSPDAFTKMKASLEQKLDSRYWVTTFSYASLASTWASHPGIAACLADYIHQVSGSAGGAKVFVVAHSMGGLAIRFATDTGRASNPVKPKELAGVVTIDTPTLGSPFGGVVGDVGNPVIEAVTKPKKVPQVPGSPGDAIDCLAPHDPGHDLKMSCGTAPYLPDGVPLHQISGDIVLEQPLFGVVQHRDLRSDGIVGVESADGYTRSGPSTDPAPSPTGAPFDRTCPTPVAGAAEFSAFTAAGFADLALLYAPAPQKVAALVVHAASVTALSVLAAQSSSCGHNLMLDSPKVAADVATTLQGWTPSDVAPAPAPAPAPSASEANLAAGCTALQMTTCDQLWNLPPSSSALKSLAADCGGLIYQGSSGYSGAEGRCVKTFLSLGAGELGQAQNLGKTHCDNQVAARDHPCQFSGATVSTVNPRYVMIKYHTEGHAGTLARRLDTYGAGFDAVVDIGGGIETCSVMAQFAPTAVLSELKLCF